MIFFLNQVYFHYFIKHLKRKRDPSSTSDIIALAFFRESTTPYATVTPILEPARAGFTWKDIMEKAPKSWVSSYLITTPIQWKM